MDESKTVINRTRMGLFQIAVQVWVSSSEMPMAPGSKANPSIAGKKISFISNSVLSERGIGHRPRIFEALDRSGLPFGCRVRRSLVCPWNERRNFAHILHLLQQIPDWKMGKLTSVPTMKLRLDLTVTKSLFWLIFCHPLYSLF